MNRKTILAVGVFVALGALGIWSSTRDRSRGVARVDLSQVDTSRATKVVLSGAHTAELVKDGDTWKLDGKLADVSAIEQLLEAVPKMRSSSLVTRSRERYADYEVDDEKGTSVELYQGANKLAAFVVGKAATGGAHVRVGSDVFSVAGVFPRTFQKSGNAWLEKKVFTADLASVTKVDVKLSGMEPYQLVKNGDTWSLEGATLPEGFRFDNQAASRLVSSLVNLRAKDILDADPGAEKTSLGDGSDVLVLYGAEGKQLGKVELGAEDEETKTTYVLAEGRPDVMTVYGASVTALRKAPLDFRDLKLMDLDTAKVTKLLVKSPEGRVELEKKDGNWTVVSAKPAAPADFTLDPAAVTRRLSALANARGTGVVEESPAATGLASPKATVTATLEDGSAVSLRLGNTTKRDDREGVFAAGNADDATYIVAPYTQNNLTGLISTFAKPATPSAGGAPDLSGLDPSALQNLPPEVRRQLEEQMRKQAMQKQLMEQLQAQQQQ